LNRPIKRKKNTGDNDDTSEEESEALTEADLAIPHDKASIQESSNTRDHEREPKCLQEIENEREMHNY